MRRRCRMRRLKVLHCNYDGMHHLLMAASSWKAFAKETGMSLYRARAYGHETGNADDIATALSAPGTVFVQDARAGYNAPWTGWEKPKWMSKS